MIYIGGSIQTRLKIKLILTINIDLLKLPQPRTMSQSVPAHADKLINQSFKPCYLRPENLIVHFRIDISLLGEAFEAYSLVLVLNNNDFPVHQTNLETRVIHVSKNQHVPSKLGRNGYRYSRARHSCTE
jgi:hypothetical protein